MAEAFPSSSTGPSSDEAKAEERLTTAEQFKQAGNGFYKEKDFKKAIGKYHRALLQVKDIDQKDGRQMVLGIAGSMDGGVSGGHSLPEGLRERATQLKVACYNNLAACLLHDTSPNYDRIVKYCEAVLDHDRENTKALYRKGVALYHRKDYEGAKGCLNRAIKQNKTDPDILRYLSLCDKAMSNELKTEKQRYQGMFKQMAEEDKNG